LKNGWRRARMFAFFLRRLRSGFVTWITAADHFSEFLLDKKPAVPG